MPFTQYGIRHATWTRLTVAYSPTGTSAADTTHDDGDDILHEAAGQMLWNEAMTNLGEDVLIGLRCRRKGHQDPCRF